MEHKMIYDVGISSVSVSTVVPKFLIPFRCFFFGGKDEFTRFACLCLTSFCPADICECFVSGRSLYPDSKALEEVAIPRSTSSLI